MDRNIKYKQVCRCGLFGDDDVFTSTNSQYNVFPSSIPGITVVAGGSNYTATATQIFLSNNNNSGFMATANISGGAINTITINNGGSGYVSTPNVIISSGISSTTSLVGGTGYVLANTQITLTGGGGGSGGVIVPTISSGVITALTISTPGSFYITTPTITISSGITGTTSIVGGSGYTNGVFTLGINGGSGSGCTGTFTISGGALTSISITSPGTGYTSAPTLSFSVAGGTGASATATLGTGASATAVVGLGAVASVNGIYTNGKRMRFALNNALNDLKLSQNARCVVETCNIPSFANMAGKYALIRLVVSTQDKTCDTKKFLNGNPILLSMATQTTIGSTNVLYNASEFFYNVNVPTNLFSNGYLDLEIEIPSAVANIDFLTNKPLSTFFLNLIIVDEDPILTKDLTLAPPIDYKNYNVNMPIRPY